MTSRAKPTSDALEILRRMEGDDPELAKLIAEEEGNAAIARQIYNLRTKHKLTQQQLAKRIGTTQSVIARLEDADYEGHSLGMLYRIARALDCLVSVAFVPMRSRGNKLKQASGVTKPTRRKRAVRGSTRKVA